MVGELPGEFGVHVHDIERHQPRAQRCARHPVVEGL
jgi:hypothetical protein